MSALEKGTLSATPQEVPRPADYPGAALAAWAAWPPRRSGSELVGDAERRYLVGASAVSSLTSALARSQDISSVIERIPQLAMELLGCGGAILLTRHRSRQMLEVTACCGAARVPSDTLVSIEGTRAGMVVRTGKPASQTGPAATVEPMLPEGVLAEEVADAVAVPVAVGGKTSGVLLAVTSEGGHGFTVEQVQLLETIADQAGVAGAVGSIAPLRQKLSDASLIAEVGRSLTGTLGLDEVLALVVRSAEMLVSGKFAGVAILSDDRSELVLTATSGLLSAHKHASMRTREAVPGWVAMTGESLSTPALSADPRGWPLGDGFGPAVLVPLESRGRIRGVLIAGRAPDSDELSEDDMDTVRKLGSYAGIAIDNARLYGEQTALSSALGVQTAELEKAYAELHASQERLLISEKMAALGRVTAGIAHEINSPLGSILNCLQLAITYSHEYRQSALDPEVTPEDHVAIATDLLETLKLAEEATRRVGQFVRTIKGQTRMEEERVTPFNPAETIRTTLNLLEHDRADRRVRIVPELATGIEMRGDANKFAVVVQNLVSNAIDSYEGAPGTVVVRLSAEGGQVRLEVEDRGSGIREEVRPRIFDYLFTTKDIGQGTGLGLSLVHSIVTSTFHGTIDYRTEIGAGTTFVVTIPLGGRHAD